MAINESFLQQAKAVFGDRVTDAAAVRKAHGLSEAYHTPQPPDLVVFPRSTGEVQQLVQFAQLLNNYS